MRNCKYFSNKINWVKYLLSFLTCTIVDVLLNVVLWEWQNAFCSINRMLFFFYIYQLIIIMIIDWMARKVNWMKYIKKYCLSSSFFFFFFLFKHSRWYCLPIELRQNVHFLFYFSIIQSINDIFLLINITF